MARKNWKYSFFVKILLPTFLTIGLFITSIYQIIIPRFEEIILDRKREMIRELTNSAWSIAEVCYNGEIEKKRTREEAQRLAIEQIRNIRYGDERKDYFWITDFQPKMIMHPYRHDLDGEDLSNFKDSHGKLLFVEIVNVVKAQGDGYVDYLWQWKDDSLRVVPKLSYVKEFKPWTWIIGTGIYIEDVKQEISLLERSIINITLGITFIMIVLLLFIAYQNIKTEKKRRRAEQELRESKERYQALVEASTEGLIMILRGKQIYYNKTLLTMLGYSEEEFPSLSFQEIFTAPLAECMQGIEDFLIREEKQASSQIETKLKKKNGDLFDVLLITSPISFLGNEGIILIVKDISRHKEIELALGESEEKYRVLTNQLTIGVFRIRPGGDGKFIDVNQAVVDILVSENKEQILNSSFIDLFDDIKEGRAFIKELLNENIIKNRIVQIRKSNNVKAVASISILAFKDESGSLEYFDGIIEDITEHQKTDEERESLIAELQTSLGFLNQPIKPFIKKFIACDMNSAIKTAVTQMAKNKTDLILITSGQEKFVGLITDVDLRTRVLAENKNLELPVHEVMTSPVISIKDTSVIYEAILRFNENDIKHLVVKDNEENVCGIICSDDIQHSNHLAFLFFIQRIQKADSVIEISRYHTKLVLLIKELIDSGAPVREMTRIITVVSDAIIKRLTEIGISEIGEPPAKFAFMALGSVGRDEQTLVTDQDNAIIYNDVEPEREEEVRKYFQQLGERVCNSLDRVGYKFCKGNVMAKNPKWCQPLSVWKKYFTECVNTANPQDLLDLNIFFDFRAVTGDESMTIELRNHLHHITAINNPFFVYFAQNALNFKTPTGLFKSGETFDIKLILLPIIDLVRVYALKHKISYNNTIERLERLHEKNIFSKAGYQELLQSYNFLMQYRFKHQSKLLSENVLPDNNINPKVLTDFEQIIIKKIFSLIDNFQSKMSLDFKGTL